MNRWETPFSEQIFRPFHATAAVVGTFPYGDWGLNFVTSVSWRTLLFWLDQHAATLDAAALAECQGALEQWRRFLLSGAAPTPSEQHLLPLDAIAGASGMRLSPYLNRYLLRGVELDVLHGNVGTIMVYTKLCRLLVLGFVHVDHPEHWQGTRIERNGALVQPTEYAVPQALLDLFNRKADDVAGAMQQLSDPQRAKIAAVVDAHKDELITSELGRAMFYDLVHNPVTAQEATEPPRVKERLTWGNRIVRSLTATYQRLRAALLRNS